MGAFAEKHSWGELMRHIAYCNLVIGIALGLLAPKVSAVTYYVDAASGNDAWEGRQATVATLNTGPWQTLARVANAVLQPGDSVLLKCGQVWHETLALNKSGTAANPITVASYPSGCQTPPTIDGALPIPAHAWSVDSNRIYKALLPANLISNGHFTTTLSGWARWSPQNDSVMALNAACDGPGGQCMSFTSGANTSIASSNSFILDGGAAYTASFSMKAPRDTRIRTVVRRSGPTYEPLGMIQYVVGTGHWQTYTFPFRATTSLTTARFDFEVPPAATTIQLDNVRVESPAAEIQQVFAADKTLDVAHHPNRGYNALKPQSLYASVSQDSDRVPSNGRPVSTYLTYGNDLGLPLGVVLAPGTSIRILTNAWILDERTITSVGSNRLYFNAPTTYALQAGWGYFLTGARWMLDEPGEWHYDKSMHVLYIWMPDGGAPGTRVAAGLLDTGIDLANLAYINLDGIRVRRVNTGLRMPMTTSVTFRNGAVEDTLRDAIDAAGAQNGVVENSVLLRIGREAIAGSDDTSGRTASGMQILKNVIEETGVRVTDGAITSLPTTTKAAVRPGTAAAVIGNRVVNTGYVGILALKGSTIAQNYIENTCLVLDDCSAIYVGGVEHNGTITNNMIRHVPGTTDGKPAGKFTQGQGIYLDELASGIVVAENTVIDADNGVQLHNAANNRIENNTLYANRRFQIWMQEQTNRLHASGDVTGNLIKGNRLFPTSAGAAVGLESEIGPTTHFASFDGNVYSTLLSHQVVSESWPTGSAAYTLPQWKLAVDSSGAPRNQDPNGSEVASVGYAAFRAAGSSLISNGDLALGPIGWGVWNQTAPFGKVSWQMCAPGHCLHYIAGSSVGLVSSPNFSVVKDQWYRASFDLKTGADNQPVTVIVRRGGGGTNGYEYLMGVQQSVTAMTTWKRFSFPFKATKTINANDPVTHDLGARVDFAHILPGQDVFVSNLEVVPLRPVEASFRTNALINPTAQAATFNCPDQTTEPDFCSQYFRFTDTSSIGWPYVVSSHSAEIVYSQDVTLTDADGDGVPDSQDSCSATSHAEGVSADGCSFSQSYPGVH